MYLSQQPHWGGKSLARKTMIDWRTLHKSRTLLIALTEKIKKYDVPLLWS
jgi:hypothetical protein